MQIQIGTDTEKFFIEVILQEVPQSVFRQCLTQLLALRVGQRVQRHPKVDIKAIESVSTNLNSCLPWIPAVLSSLERLACPEDPVCREVPEVKKEH